MSFNNSGYGRVLARSVLHENDIRTPATVMLENRLVRMVEALTKDKRSFMPDVVVRARPAISPLLGAIPGQAVIRPMRDLETTTMFIVSIPSSICGWTGQGEQIHKDRKLPHFSTQA